LIPDRHQYGVAWALYSIYEFGLWPIGTFIGGLEGLSLLWPTVAAIPLMGINYSLDRQRQADEERPASKANSLIVVALMYTLPMSLIYLLGYAIGHWWS
jgi:hypothetical protein